MKKLFILFALLLNIAIGYAQNKIDFTETFQTIGYYNSIGNSGLRSEKFSGQYRVYNHGSSLRIGLKLTPLSNSARNYIYKGRTYTVSEIPELNSINITKVTGDLKISSASLKEAERVKKGVEIYIGGYLDQSGSLGGNNIEITDKIPKSFPSSTPISFIPTSISYDVSEVQLAIERYLEKEKNKEAAKENQQKYDNFLRDADRLFAVKNYDHALAQYYSASYIDVPDKTKAENGIDKTRKLLEAQAEKEKNNAPGDSRDPNLHTYKSGECKLAGAPIAGTPHCLLCTRHDKLENQAKTTEDKRVADIKYAQAEEARKVKEAEAKRLAAEKAEALIKAQEEEAGRIASEKAEKEVRAKLLHQLKKGGDINEIDLKNIKVSSNTTEYLFNYNGITINRFPKNRVKYDISNLGSTNYFYCVDPNNVVLYKGVYDAPGKSAKIVLFDPLGKELKEFPNFYKYDIDENKKTIVFYQYLSIPEFLRFTTKEQKKDLDYRQVLGFYSNDALARNAVTNYKPPFEEWRDLQFFLVKVKATVTDFNMKVINEKEGYLLTEYHYSN